MWGVFIVHNYSFYVDVNICTGTISLLIVSCLDQTIISVKRCLVPCEDSLLVFVISANKLRFWVLVSWLEKSSTLKTSLGTCDEHFIDWTINGLDGNRSPGYKQLSVFLGFLNKTFGCWKNRRHVQNMLYTVAACLIQSGCCQSKSSSSSESLRSVWHHAAVTGSLLDPGHLHSGWPAAGSDGACGLCFRWRWRFTGETPRSCPASVTPTSTGRRASTWTSSCRRSVTLSQKQSSGCWFTDDNLKSVLSSSWTTWWRVPSARAQMQETSTSTRRNVR